MTSRKSIRLSCLMVLCIMLCTAAHGTDLDALSPNGHSQLVTLRQQIEQGHYKQALDKLNELQNLAQASDSIRTVGLMYGLSEWADLARVYQPAKRRLLALREKMVSNISGTNADQQTCHELVALDLAIDRQTQSLHVFKTLDSTRPLSASVCFSAFQTLLVDHKEYALLKKYGYQPIEHFNHVLFRKDITVRFVDPSDPVHNLVIQKAQQDFLVSAKQIVSAAKALGDDASVSNISQRLAHFNANNLSPRPDSE